MEEEEEKVKTKIVNIIDNVQQLLTKEGISEEEMEKKIKEHLKPFSENLKTIIEDIEQTQKEEDKEIESHKEFLNSLSQHPETKELMQKENELIIILENDKLFSEKFYLVFKSFLDILIFILSKDLAATSKKKNKLRYEINIISEVLREKGVIKR